MKSSLIAQPGNNIPFKNQRQAINDYEAAVFISYAWGGESERVVSALEHAFTERGIHIIRDKKELGYKGSIEAFERRIGQGQCIILVISDKYLRSEHCMYELMEVDKNRNLRDRIFPIVLAEAQIYKAIDRLNYIKHWDEQIEQLNRAIKQVDVVTNLSGFTADLDKYSSIRASFDHLTDLLSDMNALTPEMHAANGFSSIIDAVEHTMAENKAIPVQSSDAAPLGEFSGKTYEQPQNIGRSSGETRELIKQTIPNIIAGLAVALIITIVSFLYTQLGLLPSIIVLVGGSILLFVIIALFRKSSKPQNNKSVAAINVSNNLPARGHFVGREKEKKRITEGLNTNYPSIFVVGESGIGKTTIVKEIAWVLKDNGAPYKYIVWVEDHDGNLSSDELYRTIVNIWGMVDLTTVSHFDLQIQVMKYLQEKPTLIIIDNFHSAKDREVIEFVKHIPAPISKAIVTSQKKEFLDDFWVVELREMKEKESLAVARLHLQREGEMEISEHKFSDVLLAIADMAGGNPYRIKVLVGEYRLGIPLSVLSSHESFDLLLPWWDALKTEINTKKTIMAISLFQNDPTREQIQTISSLGNDDLEQGLNSLNRTLLLETIHSSKDENFPIYHIHSRTKAFVKYKIFEDKDASFDLFERLSIWVEDYCKKYSGLKNWEGYPILAEEFETIKMVIEWGSLSTDSKEQKRVVRIWRLIDHFLSVRGNYDEYINLGKQILKSAVSIMDSKSITDINVTVLGWAYITKVQRYQLDTIEKKALLENAEKIIIAGIAEYEKDENFAGIGQAKRYLGIISKLRKDYQTAEDLFLSGLNDLEHMRGLDDLGKILSDLGDLAAKQGRIDNAIAYQNKRLILSTAWNNPEGQAVALYNLGNYYRTLGRDRESTQSYLQALAAAKRASRNDIIGAAQINLAKLFLQQGDINQATLMADNAKVCFQNNIGFMRDDLQLLIDRIDRTNKKKKTPWGFMIYFSGMMKLWTIQKIRSRLNVQ